MQLHMGAVKYIIMNKIIIQGSPIKVWGPTQHMVETVDHIY